MIRDKRKLTIAIDFDGVITDSEECRDALHWLRSRAKLICFSCKPPELVRALLEDLNLVTFFDGVTDRKPRADLYVDDHGFHFDGDWAAVILAASEL